MNDTFEALVTFQEECGEAIQVVSKMLRFGVDSFHPADPKKTTNKVLLSRELGDILGMIDVLRDEGVIDLEEMIMARDNKPTKFRHWQGRSK